MSTTPAYEELERRLQACEAALQALRAQADRSEKKDTAPPEHPSQPGADGSGPYGPEKAAGALPQMIEHIGEMISRHLPDSTIVYVSPYCEHLLGYAPTELIGRRSVDFVHPDDIPDLHDILAEAIRNGERRYRAQHRLRHKDGRFIWVETCGGIVLGPDGSLTETLCVVRDVSERKAAEKALLESENRTLSILASLPIGVHIYRLEATGRLVFIGANPEADRILKTANSRFVGMTLQEAFPELVHTEVPQRYCAAALDGIPWQTEQITYDQGRIRGAFEVHAFQIGPRMMVATFRDITERKRAEVAMQSLSQRQDALLAAIPDIIMETDTEGVYIWANQAGRMFFGDDVIGRPAHWYFVGEQDAAAPVPPLFDNGERVVYIENWQRRVDGRKRLLAWWCRELEDKDGTVSGVLASARDVTEQRHLEEKLLQAQKMESIGRLAGGVAHDFNNMLQTILGHSELAIVKVGQESPVSDNLQEIQKAARRSADLTRQLLAFARKQTVNPLVLDLNDTVVGMLKMLSRLIGEDINLVWKPGSHLWPLRIDPVQVDQILANLGVNARDAISGVGTLTIETGNVVVDAGYRETQTDCLPGEYVVLAVSDTGCGMEKDIIQNIFDPFFTTKEVGKGTGLGLATVYGIVKQNNGWINVYSEPGIGTTFKIYLPRAEWEQAADSVAEEPKPAGGSETVLLVEDDESILKIGEDILQSYGYTVLATRSPKEALECIRRHTGPLELLITDVVMPGMNGRDLRDAIVARRPGIRVIFMSGYTDDVIANHGMLDPNVHFLQKPFSVTTLTGKVREVLDEP